MFANVLQVLSSEEKVETPISPGLLPSSIARQTSVSKSSSDLANLDAVLNSGSSSSSSSGMNDLGSEFMLIRDPLSALLQKLGEPPETIVEDTAAVSALGSSQRLDPSGGKNDQHTSACNLFMADFESRPDYLDLIQAVRESMIFYSSNMSGSSSSSCSSSSSNFSHEIFFFVARRVTPDTDPSALIYLMLIELQGFVDMANQEKGRDKDKDKAVSVPVFDLVIDSSSFNTDSELPMWSYTNFWSKLKSLVGRRFGKYLKKVYVMYPSVVLLMSTQKILKKWGLKTKSVMERVEVCTPTQLIAKYSVLHEKIPPSTYNIEITSLKHWPAVFQQQQVMITISNSLLLVQSKEKIGGLEFTRTDMLFLHLIESIFKSSNSSGIKSKKHGGGGSGDEGNRKKFALPSSKGGFSVGDDRKDNSDKDKTTQPVVVINYTAFHSKRTLKLQFTHTAQFVSALRCIPQHAPLLLSVSTTCLSICTSASNCVLCVLVSLSLFLSLSLSPSYGSIALTQVRQQRALEEASESAGTDTDTLSPEAIPGTLLHVAVLNLFSDSLVSD
jgi:hypothetical protein